MSVRTAAQTALVAGVITVALASAAWASAARTFVSGGGSDGNTGSNCPQGSPCRSFAAAYSVTSSGGEIIALDSAGYGEVTINGPVTIVAALLASVTVTAGTSGITINAGASDVVILKNIQINGGNAASTTCINLQQGRMVLQNSTVKFCTTGLLIAANTKSDVKSTDIIGNGTAISTSGTGSNPTNSPFTYGPTQVRVEGGSVCDNGTAFLMNAPGADNSNNQKSTVLLFGPGGAATTNISGNTTVVSCTNQTCNPAVVLTYQALTASNMPNVD